MKIPFQLFTPDTTALLVIDKQNAYMDKDVLAKRGKTLDDNFPASFDALEKFITEARNYRLPVIWTQMTEDERLSPLPIRQKLEFDNISQLGVEPISARPGHFDYQFKGEIIPSQEEVVIHKTHFDAFSELELRDTLKKLGCQSVLLCGGFASRCVLGTAYGANSYDYHVLVLEDLLFYPQQFADEVPAMLKIVNGILGYSAKSTELLETWLKL